MKQLFIFCLSLLSFSVNAQSFSNPESVVYVPSENAYYISNYGNGTILKRDDSGSISSFYSGLNHPLGITHNNGFLFVCDVDKIIKIDVSSGQLISELSIPGAQELNDICFDANANCYFTDRDANEVLRTDESLANFQVINSSLITPNGITFDAINNRLLVCTTVGNGKVYALDPSSGQETELLTTGYSNLDGITLIGSNDVLITSWSTNWVQSKLIRFDLSSVNVPQELLINQNGMADIFFNELSDTLAIANWTANSLTFLNMSNLLSVGEMSPLKSNISVFPTVLHAGEELTIQSTDEKSLSIEFYNISGALKLQLNIAEKCEIKLTPKLDSGVFKIVDENNRLVATIVVF